MIMKFRQHIYGNHLQMLSKFDNVIFSTRGDMVVAIVTMNGCMLVVPRDGCCCEREENGARGFQYSGTGCTRVYVWRPHGMRCAPTQNACFCGVPQLRCALRRLLEYARIPAVPVLESLRLTSKQYITIMQGV